MSVVLPTFNRAASLRPALEALLAQSADAGTYEVIVVDNNSTDGTAALLASIEDARIRAVREGRQGLSFARNAGIAAARAPIVAFTDDDVQVGREWVERIVSTLERRPEVDGTGGRVLPAWGTPPPCWLTRAHWAPLALQDHGPAPLEFDAADPRGLVGANLALRTSVFARIGLFSAHVQRVRDGIGSTEDHELLARLYRHGGRMLYEPDLVVTAPVQAERRRRAYHRRWHRGHGASHALMRDPDMERSRSSLFGVPGHLWAEALRDTARLAASLARADWAAAFAFELRLQFFVGFVRRRMRTARVEHAAR